MRNKLASKEKLVIVIIVSILSFIYYGLFQPQRGHFIDALQNPKSFEEFYDLKNDPFELNNIINDIRYKDEINNLREELDNWIKMINDPINIPEKELVKLLTNNKTIHEE